MLLTVVIICEVSMMLQAMLQNMPSWQNWCSVTPTFLYITNLARNNSHCPFPHSTFKTLTNLSERDVEHEGCAPGVREAGARVHGEGRGLHPRVHGDWGLHQQRGRGLQGPGAQAGQVRDKQKFQSGYLHILVEPVNFTHFLPRMVLILDVVGKRKVLCLCWNEHKNISFLGPNQY